MIENTCEQSQDFIDKQAEKFLQSLCRHVVGLSGTLIALDAGGKRTAREEFFSYSCFLLSSQETWFLVTAGHILADLNQGLAERRVAVVYCGLADYFGSAAAHHQPIPFDYQNSKKVIVDDETMGIDIGFIPLSPVYRRLLESNGVSALPFVNWELYPEIVFDHYGVVGFPEELFHRQRHHDVQGALSIGGVRPVFLLLKKSNAQPLEKPIPKHPWFAGELIDTTKIKSVKGMSGGPIFGLNSRPGKPVLYGVIAVQSWWDKQRRIAFATSLSAVMKMIEQAIESYFACRNFREQTPTE